MPICEEFTPLTNRIPLRC